MEVTRDVIRDLLPLYVSGEVSADTRRLVEAYLTREPDLARAVTAARALELPPTPAPTEEKSALDATRQLLRQRTQTLVVAILFTLLPFTFTFDRSGLSFLLIRDQPVVGGAWLLTAAVLWGWYVQLRRRLRVSGL